MVIQIDESTITVISTVISICLGLFAKYRHTQTMQGKNILNVMTKKAEIGAKLIKKIRDANEDNSITPDEFTGIVNTAEELVNS